MKIRMLQTVEDAHRFSVIDKSGEPVIQTDVRKFYEDVEYDFTGAMPDWDRRAQKLVGLGYAEEVRMEA